MSTSVYSLVSGEINFRGAKLLGVAQGQNFHRPVSRPPAGIKETFMVGFTLDKGEYKIIAFLSMSMSTKGFTLDKEECKITNG